MTLSAGLRRKRLRNAMVSARPNHFEPGKRTPAERRGEAHPMIPRGGIAVRRMHAGTDNAALPRPRVKSKHQGNASRDAAARHMNNPMSGVPWSAKKERTPGMSGQLAAA